MILYPYVALLMLVFMIAAIAAANWLYRRETTLMTQEELKKERAESELELQIW